MKKRLQKYIFIVFCVVGVLCLVSCQTSRSQTHGKTKYQRVRTRHTPKWNSTTSQSTTYYIRKNSTRKSHDSKRIKR